jgi:hypothetical protein
MELTFPTGALLPTAHAGRALVLSLKLLHAVGGLVVDTSEALVKINFSAPLERVGLTLRSRHRLLPR